MTNKYLEKVAETFNTSKMLEVHPGVYYDHKDRSYKTTREGSESMIHDAKMDHVGKAFKTLPAGFAGVGAVMALAAGLSDKRGWHNPRRVGKVALGAGLVGGALGLLSAYPIAAAGHNQLDRPAQINKGLGLHHPSWAKEHKYGY